MRKANRAAQRAHYLFSLFGWEWGIFHDQRVPDEKELTEKYISLRDTLIEKYGFRPETTQTISSGRLLVTLWPNGDVIYGVETGMERR